MRLFIAIQLNDEIKEYLVTAMEDLKKAAAKGNFTRQDNLHLTLVFLGELRPDQLGAVKSAMNKVEERPFRLFFTGFGKFKRNSGDIHWAGVEKSAELLSLQSQLANELEKEGFALEKREYSPHLTLGREIRLSDPNLKLYDSFLDVKKEMTVSRFSLMVSERVDGKLTYTEIYNRNLLIGDGELS